MKCKYIIVVAHIGQGDDDSEILANMRSLITKYGAQQGTRCFEIYHTAGTPFDADELGVIGEQIALSQGTVGIYFLCHGAAQQMKPDPDLLAELVYAFFFKGGIPLNKINLAACKGAGGKFHQPTFEKSSAWKFCKTLETLADSEKFKLPNALAVCAYNVNITTFDPSADIFRQKKYANTKLVGFDQKEGDVHSAIMTYSGNDVAKLEVTHPPVQAHGALLANALNVVVASCNETAWTKCKGAFGEVGKKYNSLAEANGDGAQIQAAKLSQYGAQFNKAMVHALNGFTGDKQLMNAIESYVQNKIVLVFRPATGRFEVGSIADYTDNGVLRDLVTAVESSSMFDRSPRVKLNMQI
ncbi:hypothetical protein [Paraburkholderia sacchari]|uniref:hypothetical protein n=1 Tax=Paraburkholderia sacchari TaxID=159450 RepID=UPI001BCB7D28|nr:hypothetical protein [Paraburkholderia sacchari]